MKSIIVICTIYLALYHPLQNPVLSIKALAGSDPAKPLILYITGDGGWNDFSNSLISSLNKNGYPVIGLNAKSYWWNRKQPDMAANEIGMVLTRYCNEWNRKQIMLIGYSFGADVLPFLQTRLKKQLQDNIRHTVLMSPSKTTDFEIHLINMAGFGSNSGERVTAEINRLTTPVTVIFGSDEENILLKNKLPGNIKTVILNGGHHYDGNIAAMILDILAQR